MAASDTELLTQISGWTEDDVHQWLVKEVKVGVACADTFRREEVTGRALLDFEKKDMLDLRLKHGAAVKIISFRERRRAGSHGGPGFPEHVEGWTREQVRGWLLQKVGVKAKEADLLLNEDVSGDCLVCCRKQDLLEMGLKHGPTVLIVKALERLKKRPEETRHSKPPSMAPNSHNKINQPKMKSPAVIIKNVLDSLGEKDLKSFIFHLKQHNSNIPQSKLEGADTIAVATLITNCYDLQNALRVTQELLEGIGHRALASRLQSCAGGMEPTCQNKTIVEETDESSSSSSSSSCRKRKGTMLIKARLGSSQKFIQITEPNLSEFLTAAFVKFGVPAAEGVKVLDSSGTEVDEDVFEDVVKDPSAVLTIIYDTEPLSPPPKLEMFEQSAPPPAKQQRLDTIAKTEAPRKTKGPPTAENGQNPKSKLNFPPSFVGRLTANHNRQFGCDAPQPAGNPCMSPSGIKHRSYLRR